MAQVSPKDVEKFLKGVDYPARKQDLIRHAQQQNADQRVLETLRQLPEQTFDGPIAVNRAIGEVERQAGSSQQGQPRSTTR
ncbi:MAG: DUF2795 domain-containing protein [Ktedonobacteraceae bacterium]|nr:DUF2795 domain-containing protein [Ktedonobacteraceae bacterium]